MNIMNIMKNIAKHSINITKNITNITAIFCACVLITAYLCVLCSSILPLNGEQKIYSDIIRLHVLANSDTDDDQNLKFEVRDYILSDIANLTKDCENAAQASEKIQTGLKNIEIKAADFINQKGYDYNVTAHISKEIYPVREYADISGEDFVFPAGKYQSLQIVIGEGEGKNWWCVLFPPLCLSGSKIEDELGVAGYTNEQIKILKKDKSGKYVIRFKILEILEGILK